MLKRACVLPAVLGTLLLASAGPISADIDPDDIPQVGLPDGLVMEVFLADLNFPVSMAWTANGELFFTEKATGRVRYYDGERLRETPFAELPVNAEIERGLLGVTVDPAYEENRLVYIFYPHADPLSNRVIRMRNKEGTRVDPVVLLDAPISTGFFNHNGGNTAFGPDGLLYVTLGENNFPPWSAQLDVPYWKILRIDPADGSAPVDNPFYDDGEGYAVTDDDDALFHSKFERLGGIEVLGFPVSNRYTRDGAWYQAFKRAVLRWDRRLGMAVYTNVLDDLSAAGLDDVLLDEYGIVRSEAWDQDAGLPFNEVIQNHLGLLNRSSLIRNTFLANDRWLQQYGLPMGLEDIGAMTVLRAQRAVLIWDRSSIGIEVRLVWGTELAMDVDYIPADALRRRP